MLNIAPTIQGTSNNSLKKGSLSQGEIEALSSTYLNTEIARDEFRIDAIISSKKGFSTDFSLTSFGVSPSDISGFHLSSPTLFRAIAQSSVIHLHWLLGETRKKHEIWIRDYSLSHRKPIRHWENIKVEAELVSFREFPRLKNMCRAEYRVNVENGAVLGNAIAFVEKAEEVEPKKLN